MITRIREVRRARRMTLQDVADRCEPPTTPQTIGRLETGTRTVSVGWLNRIAGAARSRGLRPRHPARARGHSGRRELDHDGAHAPRREASSSRRAADARPDRDDRLRRASATIAAATRSGSPGWPPDEFAGALNRDVLSRPRRTLPVRPADRPRGLEYRSPHPPSGRRPAPDRRHRSRLGGGRGSKLVSRAFGVAAMRSAARIAASH